MERKSRRRNWKSDEISGCEDPRSEESEQSGKSPNYEDDGRTIADMSDVPHGFSGDWHLPGSEKRDGSRKQWDSADAHRGEAQSKPWEDAPISRKERRMYTLGAMKAALLIGLAYLVGLGLLIGLLVLIW